MYNMNPAFSSLFQMEQGVGNHIPPPGIMALVREMKNRYGGTEAWKKFMNCDSTYIVNTTEAYGYREGSYYTFTAKKLKTGWLATFTPGIPQLTREEVQLLRSAGSTREALRNAKKYQATLVQENLSLRRRLVEKRNELDKVKEMEQSQLVKPFNIGKWIGWILLLCLLVVGVARAEDCSESVNGCYLMETDNEMQFDDLVNLCYGQTTTVIRANSTHLLTSCMKHMAMMTPEVQDWQTWCMDYINTRLHKRKCTKFVIDEAIRQQIAQVYDSMRKVDTTFVRYMSRFGILVLSLIGCKDWYKVGFLVISIFFPIKPVILMLATAFLRPFSLGVLIALAWLQLEFNWLSIIFGLHWLITVTLAIMAEDVMYAVSVANLMSCLVPFLHFINAILHMTELPELYHLIVVCVCATVTAGFKYAYSTISVIEPDGTVRKEKRLIGIKDSVRRTLAKMQAVVRGVIPQFPDKADCIVQVESSVGSGVGFRYMNYLYTAGHVVGDDTIVKIKWKTLVMTTKVMQRIEMPECPDHLVKMRLPPEMMGTKPLRLSKEKTSDYVQLVAFDPGFLHAVNYTGWGIFDGFWLSTSFETHPGNSGGPYIDRYGRLLGIHLGTQGVVAQGYLLTHVLGSATVIDADPQPQKVETTGRLIEQSVLDVDAILEKLIEGTKVSHAALLAQIEQMNEKVLALEKKLAEPTKLETLQPQKKRLKKRDFLKAKVLTEEQYQAMLDEGWSAAEIDEAVNSLREQAWNQYEIDDDEDSDIDDYITEQIEREFISQGLFTMESGKRTQNVMQMVLAQKKKVVRKKPFKCRYCDKEFRTFHDIRGCKVKTGKNVKTPPVPEKKSVEIASTSGDKPEKN
nr:MAG: nonstructural polyprotein [Astroviridae sp.]